MNCRKIFAFAFILSVSMQVFAQHYKSFRIASKYVSEVYDITYKRPKGFIDMKLSEPWFPGGGRRGIGLVYSPILQSKDNNCIIMYPNAVIREAISAINQAKGEIEAALGLVDETGRRKVETVVDFDKYITVYTGQQAKRCFNADSVFVSEIPLIKAYRESYTHCVGIYICKKDRPTLFLKCFFTIKGKMNERKYLKLLYKKIWYRNNKWSFDEEKEVNANYNLFYKKHYSRIKP